MSKALFITRQDVIAKSPLNGNIDPDKIMQHIELAQDIHIQQQLGTDLYNKLQADIIAGTLAGDYLALIVDYIKPMHIHYAVLEYMHYAAYSISNAGAFRATPENSTVMTKGEIDALIEKQRSVAAFYTTRFNDYMSNNAATRFPEYYTNSSGDMYPQHDQNYTNWNI